MRLPHSTSSVQADFDRLALLSEQHSWSHNDHYHSFMLKQVPPHCVEALDIGCGTGAFSRELAARSDRVVAIDLSPQMIRVARERSKQYPNIDFQIANILEWEFPVERFDCIVSIATLHHLPLEMMLSKMQNAVKTNGTLIVLDIFRVVGLADLLTSALAVPTNFILRVKNSGQLREPPEIREVWAEHGRHDSYLTVSQVRRICAALLPSAKVRRHLLWRYSVVWKKPTTS